MRNSANASSPCLPAQAQVEQYELEIRVRLDQLECTTGVGGLEQRHVAVELSQNAAQRSADQRMIVYDQYLHRAVARVPMEPCRIVAQAVFAAKSKNTWFALAVHALRKALR